MPMLISEDVGGRGGPLILRNVEYKGLTKREHFAAMAMQGLLGTTHAIENLSSDQLAKEAVDMADELLKALEQSK